MRVCMCVHVCECVFVCLWPASDTLKGKTGRRRVLSTPEVRLNDLVTCLFPSAVDHCNKMRTPGRLELNPSITSLIN